MRDADKLPHLNRRFRVFLHRLGKLRDQVEGRSGSAATPVRRLAGDAPSVRAAVAELVDAQRAASVAEGMAPEERDLRLALWLMALCGDAAFGHLPGWGQGDAAPVARDFPPSDELAADSAPSASVLDQADRVLEARVPQPHRAELYLLALGGGAVADREAADERLPRLARTALPVHGTGPGTPGMEEPLFPEAYPAPRRRSPARRLPAVTRWIALGVGTALGLLLLSFLVWGWATGDLQTLLRLILHPLPSGGLALLTGL